MNYETNRMVVYDSNQKSHSSSSSDLGKQFYLKLWKFEDLIPLEEQELADEFYSKALVGNEILLEDYEFKLDSFNWERTNFDFSGISQKDRKLRIEIIPRNFR